MNPSGNAGTYGRIVVGVDDTAGGLAALRQAVGLARDSGSQLVAVRSWELGLPRHGGRRNRHARHLATGVSYHGTQQRANSRHLVRQALRAAGGGLAPDVPVTIRTPHGDPGVALTTIARAGDVLVVGTEPRHNMRRLVHGSVSDYCRAHAHCRVVVVAAENRQ